MRVVVQRASARAARTSWRIFLGCLVVAGWGGCVAAPRPIPATSAVDPEALLAVVRDREDGIDTMRASFSARTRERDRERAADGVLLVQKPDRFRLRLMLPMGVTVFDYLTVGSRTQLTFPLENKVINGAPEGEWAAFSRDDLSQAFLRGAHAFPGTCRALEENAAAVVVACRDAAGRVQRRLVIDRATATVREEVSYTDEQPRLLMRFGDYRMVAAIPMPFRIELQYPARAVVVEITVRTTEINPHLDATMFEPLAPWGAAGS